MYWLNYRQARTQLVSVVVFLAALGVVLMACASQTSAGLAVSTDFLRLFRLVSWMPVLPIGVGIFLGAPLIAAEYERGTSRLAWTQSVSRGRWLTSKLVMLSLLVTLAGLAFGAIIEGWLDAYGGIQSADRFNDTALFSITGVAAGAWWLFGFLLGTAAGALIRKTLPAIAVTVVVFLAVLIAFFNFRSGYATPVAVLGNPVHWRPAGMLVDVFYDAQGTSIGWLIQPPERYWQFQRIEAGILTAGSLLLVAGTAFTVRRRI